MALAAKSVRPSMTALPEYATIVAFDKSRAVNEGILSAINSKSAALISPEITRDVSPVFSPTFVAKLPGVEVTDIADAQKLIEAKSVASDSFIFIT